MNSFGFRIVRTRYGFKFELLRSIKRLQDAYSTVKLDVESEQERKRYVSYFQKEPETLEWIRKVIKKTDTLYDIGANIGVYSLYARSFHGNKIKVVAIEPVYHNFYKLCKNIEVNRFADSIFAYNIGLFDKTAFEVIYLSSLEAGSAGHTVGTAIDNFGESFDPKFKHGIYVVKIDDLLKTSSLPFPNHLKIDIDGSELKVLKGGLKTLSNKKLKSVMIEITNIGKNRMQIEKLMKSSGFNTNHKINFQTNHSNLRRQKGDRTVVNILFTR